MFLLDDLLLAPLKGLVWIGKNFQERAGEDLTDSEALRKKLLELQLLYEMDEIPEEEYTRRESEILDRLETIECSAEEHGRRARSRQSSVNPLGIP